MDAFVFETALCFREMGTRMHYRGQGQQLHKTECAVYGAQPIAHLCSLRMSSYTPEMCKVSVVES